MTMTQTTLRTKALSLMMEVKSIIRRVRTPAGVKKYGQPIGSIIVRDGEPPLANLTAIDEVYEGIESVKGSDGKNIA